MVGLTPSTPIFKLPMQTINRSLRLILTQTRSGRDTYGSRSLNITTVKRQNNTFRRIRQQKRQMVGRMSQVSNEGDTYCKQALKGFLKRRLIRTSMTTVKDPRSKYLCIPGGGGSGSVVDNQPCVAGVSILAFCRFHSPSSLSKFLS